MTANRSPSLSNERTLSNRSSIGNGNNQATSRRDIKVFETQIEPDQIYGVDSARSNKDFLITQSILPGGDSEDDFEVSDHMLNDTVFLQRPTNRNSSIGGDLHFSVGRGHGGSAC